METAPSLTPYIQGAIYRPPPAKTSSAIFDPAKAVGRARFQSHLTEDVHHFVSRIRAPPAVDEFEAPVRLNEVGLLRLPRRKNSLVTGIRRRNPLGNVLVVSRANYRSNFRI